eukprot:TRINITY_DN9_c7_g1_i1.p1 TRINITY_DN9_c7_g1~~TRINITY_DN9_c7_g1_i1.p1  ORF type:complete len:365 (+),score=69.92 TRINITY_DN9_c7_g1_i1:88-1182(+)
MLSATLAALATAGIVNGTFYRVTPKNYSNTVTNMDTGDVKGDCMFGLMELTFPFWCPENPNELNCRNVPILNIPGYNIYEEYQIEHDERLGVYGLCNPNPDTGVFECQNFGQCWFEDPNIKAAFESVCDLKKCHCDAAETLSVGAEFCPLCHNFPVPQPNLPDVCYTHPTYSNLSVSFKTVLSNETLDSAECCSRCNLNKACDVLTYENSTSRCVTGNGIGSTKVDTNTWTMFKDGTKMNGTATMWLGRIAQAAQKLNGTWFSTQAPGECQPGQTVGEDCWWRKLSMTRRINSTCVSNNIIKGIRQQKPACWDTCPSNYKLDGNCSVTCLYDAVSALPAERVCDGFTSSFASSDPAHLGCPDDY